MKTGRYIPNEYWDDIISKDFSISGVGFVGLGRMYNSWLYKAKVRALHKLLVRRGVDPAGKQVLDIGVGTGYYIEFWKRKGVAAITALDISATSVSELAKRYPESEFVKADITNTFLPPELVGKKFDIITAFDVLFHVVEEEKFEQALVNIKQLSHRHTVVLIFDLFLTNYRPPWFNEMDRTRERYEQALKKIGLRSIEVVPIFYYLNNPIDKSALHNPIAKVAAVITWSCVMMLPFLMRFLRPIGEVLGYVMGFFLYVLDGIILEYVKDGPSTKLMLVTAG